MAIAEDLAIMHEPDVEDAFKIEQHGIDFIPESERWATPKDIFGMWAGASVQIEYFIYGAILMTFGLTFAQVIVVIVLGNLSYFLLGLCSLQGPQTGTAVFAINRAPFGPNGSRPISLFNWVTQIGFEVEGLILIVGAGLVLITKAGFSYGDPAEVILVISAVLIQGILPFLGHAAIVKSLRALTIPFVILFAVLLGFAIPHAHLHGVHSADWETYTEGLAFTIALSGLGWTECGNDYTRYVPRDASKGSIVGWMFLGTAIPEIFMMVLGAATFTFISSSAQSAAWNGSNPFEALHIQHTIPSWVVALFLIFAIVQLFGINSLDLYSSGVSLQAMGLKLKRYQAVVLDSILACGLTIWAMFQSTFSLYMKEFVGVIIVWIAPWLGIYLMDWIIRKYRYSASELQRDDKSGIYFVGKTGVNWNSIVAFVVGMVCSTIAFSKAPPPVNFPFHWMTPISNHYGGACAGNLVHNVCSAGWYGGADFSVPTGIIVAALVYFVLEKVTGNVARQVAKQQELEPTS